MEIILMDKVTNLGNLGDVVNVKAGYARNFLIPTGQAKRANKVNIAAFSDRKAELEKVSADKLAIAQARAEKLAGYTVQISQKAGVDGRLFGSVTNADIAEALKTQGFDIEKADLRLPLGPLKQIGDTQIEVALHTDVVATITVSVLGEH